ncbi:anthranilate synthase component II [Tropicibacter sp. S64]|uniref:anthranilate synthase component II n=1 Tax=Tropicibacter sp. S64 TaxID=3415122 RepID=UPI003C79F14A
MTDTLRILLIDNYDSFTFNLLHMLEEKPEVELTLVRNDDDFLPRLEAGEFDGALIGPGPGSAEDEAYFGRNAEVILNHGTKGLPILGVCLGFQGIFHLFGGKLRQAALPVHGKVSGLDIRVVDEILTNVPNGSKVMRYHSIIADPAGGIPDVLEATAYAEETDEFAANGAELMAFRHRDLPIFGVQFHPESFGTNFGHTMIDNFCKVVAERKEG